MLALDVDGGATAVEVQFRNCREYVVETLLHFGEGVTPEGAATAPEATPAALTAEGAAKTPEAPPAPLPPEIRPEPQLEIPTEAAAEEPIARQALDQAVRRAASYIAQLPDFLCVQTTHSYLDPSGTRAWKQGRTVTHHLQYVAGQEQYSEAAKGPSPQGFQEQKAVLSSTGEFASLLKTIFAPEVKASFQWKGAEVIDGEPLFVYSFRADRSRARYSLTWGSYPTQVAAVGFEGVVYIDQKVSNPRRIEIRATELPAGFPMHDASLSVQYDYITLGDRSYLLPTRAVTICSYGKHHSQLRNEIEFSGYRKYSVESKIGFDPGEN
jgi:hypothetical protein